MEFLTGFDGKLGTLPGHTLQNESFAVTLRNVHTLGVDAHIAFENCYDWTPLMNIILNVEHFKHFIKSVDTLKEAEDVSEMVEYLLTIDIAKWVKSFSGWGLLWNIIKPNYQEFFSEQFQKLRVEMKDEVDYCPSKVFIRAVESFKNEHNLGLEDILPPISIFINDNRPDKGRKFNHREKEVFIQLENIFVVLTIKKKELSFTNTLVDLAADVIARSVKHKRDFRVLEIPLSLILVLEDKLWDLWWMETLRKDSSAY